ncbi:MAG TPA: hypothetical protein VGD65_20315 [Chryseosolibacter sp.]
MKRVASIFFFISILACPKLLIAQKFEGQKFLSPSGDIIKVGDTLQLGKGLMGKHYKFITYKYVGMPSVTVKKRGPASTDHEGTVLFVDKISPKEGLIILKGIPYYKFECKAVDAFKGGELKTYGAKTN